MLEEYGLEFDEFFDYPSRFDETDKQTEPYRMVYHWCVRDKSSAKMLLTNFHDTGFTSWDRDALKPELLKKERRLNIVITKSWEGIYQHIIQRILVSPDPEHSN